jgi:hypothetical protein
MVTEFGLHNTSFMYYRLNSCACCLTTYFNWVGFHYNFQNCFVFYQVKCKKLRKLYIFHLLIYSQFHCFETKSDMSDVTQGCSTNEIVKSHLAWTTEDCGNWTSPGEVSNSLCVRTRKLHTCFSTSWTNGDCSGDHAYHLHCRCYRHCLDSGKLSLSKNYLRVTEPGVLAWKKSIWKKQKMRKHNRIRYLMYIISQGKEGVWETVIIFKHCAPFTVFFITHNHHVYSQGRSAFVQV